MSSLNLPEGWLEQRKWEVGMLLAGLIIIGAGLFILKTENSNDGVEILSAATEATYSGMLVVDIEGAVNNPGVYELASDTRIEGAIKAAGGLSGEADINWVEANINRAKQLQDGEKIYIPKKAEQQENVTNYNAASGISINSASESELDTLPGVGPVTAGKIIAGRPYQQLEELTERKIVNQTVYNQIKDLITLW
jgi:competence protein ComEA